ncbi:MAG: hypothetical protein ACR2NR_21460 [Solirubrobacteraceae bacterium]
MAFTRADIATSALRLLDDGYGLWLASNGAVLSELQLQPCGVPVTPLDFLGPYERAWKLEDLMRVYNVLNATAFGPKSIPLQNWVMIDLGLLPSAFLLVTLPAAQAAAALTDPRRSAAERARIGEVLPAVLAEAERLGYAGPIPVAGYCAAPTPRRDAWVGWSLCSAIPGLGSTAKALALAVYEARTLTGVAQFYDPALRVHRKFGPMRLLAAVLDLHPVRHTMAYRTDVFAPETEGATPTLMLDPRDLGAQRALQAKLDAGTHELFILSPGLVDDRVPILERC